MKSDMFLSSGTDKHVYYNNNGQVICYQEYGNFIAKTIDYVKLLKNPIRVKLQKGTFIRDIKTLDEFKEYAKSKGFIYERPQNVWMFKDHKLQLVEIKYDTSGDCYL